MTWSYEVEVPAGTLMKRQLHLTTGVVTFNGKSIPVAAIEVVRVEVVRHSTNGIPTNTSYKIALDGNGQSLTLNWAVASLQKQETKNRAEQAYRTLLDMVTDQAGPRIVQRQLSMPLPAKFGPYTFSADGIEASGLLSAKAAPWASIVGAAMSSGVYTVHYMNEQGKQKTMGGMSLWEPNAIFFQQIFQAYRNHFIGR